MYPDIDWHILSATPEVLKDYGDGFILTGAKGVIDSTYFILWEDPRKDEWIKMITSNIEEKINGR